MDTIRAQFCACFLQDFNQRPPRSGKNAVTNHCFPDTTKCTGRDFKKDWKMLQWKTKELKRRAKSARTLLRSGDCQAKYGNTPPPPLPSWPLYRLYMSSKRLWSIRYHHRREAQDMQGLPVKATEESRSKVIFPSGLGYSISLHSAAGLVASLSRC